jgi:hypothetical protein
LQECRQNYTTNNFVLVCVGSEEGCVGVVGVVTGTSAPHATCTCACKQVSKRTTNQHGCKIQYFKIKVKPCVVRDTLDCKTIKYDRLGRGLPLMSVNIRVLT